MSATDSTYDPQPERSPASMVPMSRRAALVEVGLVFTLALVLSHWLLRGLSGWPLEYAAGVMQIVVPVLILLVARRDFAAYGLTWKQ